MESKSIRARIPMSPRRLMEIKQYRLTVDGHPMASAVAYLEHTCELVAEIERLKAEADTNGDEINAKEAIYGFAAWLTCRRKPITLSSKHGAGAIVDLIEKYCLSNKLNPVRRGWDDKLVQPDD